jgi:hypothetical protein
LNNNGLGPEEPKQHQEDFLDFSAMIVCDVDDKQIHKPLGEALRGYDAFVCIPIASL